MNILSSIGNALHFETDALKFGPAEKGQLKPDAMTISSAYGEKLGTLEWTSRSSRPGSLACHRAAHSCSGVEQYVTGTK